MLTRWYPFSSLERMVHTWEPVQAIDRVFQHLDIWLQPAGRVYPPLELIETPQELVLRAEVPGISPEDLQVDVTETEVHLKGTLRGHTVDQGSEGEYVYSERRTGSFYRAVGLPCPVDPSQSRARYKSGILEVRMPKKQAASGAGRRLPIELQ